MTFSLTSAERIALWRARAAEHRAEAAAAADADIRATHESLARSHTTLADIEEQMLTVAPGPPEASA